jgi:hypothetical protein
VPGCSESISFSHVFRQARIQHAQPRSQYATVGRLGVCIVRQGSQAHALVAFRPALSSKGGIIDRATRGLSNSTEIPR